MERTEVLEMMGELKLYGMKSAYDEIYATALKRQHEPQQLVGDLLKAEISEKHARSIRYQLASAKLPLAKDIDDFVFESTPINENLVRALAGGAFIAQQRNVVLVGGTGTGKTHLAIAIARSCIRTGSRARFFNTVDLVNRLEAESRSGRQGRLADYLTRLDIVILDELGYLPFAQAGGQLLFHLINRKRVQRLMRVMGIEALVPRPGTSKAAPGHEIHPYLLRGLAITEPNHVWAADITYIPMARGFLYLVAIIDWASRAVMAWRLSNTIDAGFCVEALEDALLRHGKPKIFNTDQGAQFTSAAFTGKLEAAGVAISMDGRGRFMDNIFIERLWRSIKYEEVHLKAYADGREARAGISSWMTFYNLRRPHQALNNQMPMAVWRAGMDKIEAAAKTVDMPLRLDNANALPTYPQQKQKQQKAA